MIYKIKCILHLWTHFRVSMVPTLRGGMGRGLLSLSREMKVKKAETARYFPVSGSTSEEASTNTSISIDLLLTNVSRPVTVTTQPWREETWDEKNTLQMNLSSILLFSIFKSACSCESQTQSHLKVLKSSSITIKSRTNQIASLLLC